MRGRYRQRYHFYVAERRATTLFDPASYHNRHHRRCLRRHCLLHYYCLLLSSFYLYIGPLFDVAVHSIPKDLCLYFKMRIISL